MSNAWKNGAWSGNAWSGTVWAEGEPADLSCVLNATEAQDTASFAAEMEQEEQGGWSEYVRPIEWPLRARLFATEARDVASFAAKLDDSDDEIIMALMMAAWEEEVSA